MTKRLTPHVPTDAVTLAADMAALYPDAEVERVGNRIVVRRGTRTRSYSFPAARGVIRAAARANADPTHPEADSAAQEPSTGA